VLLYLAITLPLLLPRLIPILATEVIPVDVVVVGVRGPIALIVIVLVILGRLDIAYMVAHLMQLVLIILLLMLQRVRLLLHQ